MAFLSSYIELGLLTKGDIHSLLHQENRSSKEQDDESTADPAMKVAMIVRAMRHKVQKLCTKVLLDSRFKSIQCSAVASAIVFYARRCCCLFSSFGAVLPVWNDELTKMTFHHPLKHRATMQALALLFEMEGESTADFNMLLSTEELNNSSAPASPEKTVEKITLVETPNKSENISPNSVETPSATTAVVGKNIDASPVSMATVFGMISP